jgi:MFS superfamily sulfate permease-like transporter
MDLWKEASMGLAQVVVSLQLAASVAWRADWALGLPMIVLNVLIHVLGLSFINQKASFVLRQRTQRRYPEGAFAAVVGTATLLATSLHAAEAGIWSIAYRLLGALPDYKSAMLYSLNAMTSYGHESLILEARWQLLGAIEALNGCLLFGLSTAFLFGIIQKVWSMDSMGRH